MSSNILDNIFSASGIVGVVLLTFFGCKCLASKDALNRMQIQQLRDPANHPIYVRQVDKSEIFSTF